MKVALVTGAARGIGLATAKIFLAEGWGVVLVDWDGEELQKATADLGENALGLVVDVSDPDQVSSMIRDTLERFCLLYTSPSPRDA